MNRGLERLSPLIETGISRIPHESFAKKTSSRLKRRSIAVVGVISLLVPTTFASQFPEATGLGLNLFATYVDTPNAPIDVFNETDVKTQKVAELYDTMITRFGTHTDLLLEKPMPTNLFKAEYAMNWPYGRALEAVDTMTFLPSVQAEAQQRSDGMLKALEKYWNADTANHHPGYDPGLKAMQELAFNGSNDRYIDDNLWISQLLMKEYWQTRNPQVLDRVRQIYALVKSQWDTPRGGGIFWKQQFDDETAHGRGVVSNAPAIILGAELYQATGDKTYLQFSERTRAWITESLQDKTDGLFFDNVDYTGVIGKAKWSYCQGVMIGALVRLHDVAPETYSLDDAIVLASRALNYFDRVGYEGHSQIEEDNAFNAIFFKNLLYLASEVHDPAFTQRVRATLAERVNNLSDTYDTLLGQAGALHLAALNAMDPRDYSHLY